MDHFEPTSGDPKAFMPSAKKPKLFTQEKTKIFQPKMEDVIFRFPHLAEKMFDSLGNKSLTICQEVSTSWNDFVCKKKFYLIRVIEGEVGYFHVLGGDWKKVFIKAKTETIMKLRRSVGQFYDRSKTDILIYHEGLNPSHVAAGTGNLELLESVEKITMSKNPKDEGGFTLLHYAARNGHLNVIKYVMEFVDNKNPESKEDDEEFFGITPLQLASSKVSLSEAHWKICEYMLENIEGILCPKTFNWNELCENPLIIAAMMGNLKLCKIILKNIDNEKLYILESYCKDACSKASLQGHWEVVILIGNFIYNKLHI